MTQSVQDDSHFLTEFFEALNERSVSYCVMGNTASLPRIPENDVDLICARDDFTAVTDVIETLAARHGGCVAQMLRHESQALYHVLYLPLGDGQRVYLKLDICSDYVIDGRLFLSADVLLKGRRLAGNAPFYVASAKDEFAYYLLKKISKGFADSAALRHLSALLASDREGCRAVLRQYWSVDSAALIERVITAERWADLQPELGELQRQMHVRLPPRSARLWLAELARSAERVFRPTGFVVGVLGPDGSGKGTLLAGLLPRVSALGRNVAWYHLMPPLRGKGSGGVIADDPHGQTPRGVLMSTLKLMYFVAAYNLGWLRSVWMARRRSGLIFFDRYYHDILVDPRRYRNGAPRWIVRMAGRFVPTPDLFLILDVRPEVVRARKAEVSVAEGERQFAAYRTLSSELSNAQLIDASLSPMLVVSQCEAAIARAMAERLKRRMLHASG